MSHKVIEELKKIHSQVTVPAAILMSIRTRFEFKQQVSNRIGKMFKNGGRGVLLVGKAGTSKTTILNSIYEGLELDTARSQDGNRVGVWISSSGSSTALGIYETLKQESDSIIFIDEFGMDSTKHLHILKQVCNGELTRQTYREIETHPFSGTIIAATNGIKMPKPAEMEHLLATLDRYLVVKVESPDLKPEDYIEKAFFEPIDKKGIDWTLIKENLFAQNYANLNENEKSLLIALWQEKSREVLDVTRAQWRNSKTAIDIMLFVKRLLQIKDITLDTEAIELVKNMIDDLVMFNPVGILFLPPSEEIIYKVICNKSRAGEEACPDHIKNALESSGIDSSRRTMYRVIERLIEAKLVHRTKHGKYSTKRLAPKVSERSSKDVTYLPL